MSAWEGDLSELGRLEENLAELAEVPSRAAKDACIGIRSAIREQFLKGIDPYGKPWESLAPATIAKGRKPPPMTDTGTMKLGMQVRPMGGSGIAVTSDAEYLGFHQGQGSPNANVPPRHVLPEGELPETWEDAIDDALDDHFGRVLS